MYCGWQATFAASIAQSNGYYYFELQYGPTQVALGFPSVQDARLWLSGMMEAAGAMMLLRIEPVASSDELTKSWLDAADENSAGRRAWMANLRRMMTLNLRDRRELVPAMADRDWFSEWNFCLR
jgi:hypothetical protein